MSCDLIWIANNYPISVKRCTSTSKAVLGAGGGLQRSMACSWLTAPRQNPLSDRPALLHLERGITAKGIAGKRPALQSRADHLRQEHAQPMQRERDAYHNVKEKQDFNHTTHLISTNTAARLAVKHLNIYARRPSLKDDLKDPHATPTAAPGKLVI